MTDGNPRTRDEKLHDLERANRMLGLRNAKLAELLKASRDHIDDLTGQLNSFDAVPSSFGVLLCATHTVDDNGLILYDISAHGRRLRVVASSAVKEEDLLPGRLVRLGENSHIMEVVGYPDTGELARVLERLPDGRVLVALSSGQELIVHVSAHMAAAKKPPRPGDSVLVDTKAGIACEKIPKAEVAQLALEEIPNVSYEDIGGLDEQITKIHDAVELPFLHPELYREYDLAAPKGVLLYGPPGCGKTLIAKAVAHSLASRAGGEQSASYFLNIKGPELLNKWVGESERQIRCIFDRARELAEAGRPVVVFFDEMESIFRTRGSGVSSDMETTIVPQLLAELDGVESLTNVIVIGATNREELLDPAILRPGRLDVKIRVQRPGRNAAADIFATHLKSSVPCAAPCGHLIEAAVEHLFTPKPFVELTLIDRTTEVLHYSDFLSGAMIANIVQRAKKNAIKDHLAGKPGGITAEHLIAAIDAEYAENEDLPNTANPQAWSRLAGRHGLTVTGVRVIG